MVHDVHAIREDLAFMRALAQEGRRAPLLVGHNLLVGGIVYALTCLFAWGVATQALPLPQWWQEAGFGLATLGYVAYARLHRMACVSNKPGATAVTNRAVSAVWRGVGFSMISLGIAAFLISYETGSARVFSIFPSIVMAAYGACWTVAAAMSELKWLRATAAGCFFAAVVLALSLAWGASIYPVFAVAMLALMALPGWLLMRGEPPEVV